MSVKAKFAATIHRNPSKKMKVVLVTGVDGGLEAVANLESIFNAANVKVGVITSQYISVAGKQVGGSEKADILGDIYRLQGQLGHMRRAKCKVVVIEVPFEVPHHHFAGIHVDMLVVRRCGDKLLDGTRNAVRLDQVRALLKHQPTQVVLNSDDPSYLDIKKLLPSGVEVMTFGTKAQSELKITDVRLIAGGCKMKLLVDHHNELIIDLPLPGKQIVYSAVAAVAAGYLFHLKVGALHDGIEQIKRVHKFFEPMRLAKNYNVVIDACCSPSGIVDTLVSLKHFTKNRVIAVLGPSLNMNSGWLEMIGESVAKTCDRVIICDNEYYEGQKKSALRKQLMNGVSKAGAQARSDEIADRHEAVAKALAIARRDDTVVILGTSRREYRQLGVKREVWNDRKIVKEILGVDKTSE